MLCHLLISNIAIIKNAEVVFEDGLNVITGETGAGKSLVIDSLNMVLGERGSRDIIRSGEKSARVEALFLIPEGVLPPEIYDGGSELLLYRELFHDGRNVCKVNGSLATVSQLKEIGRHIINIHGQHDNQSLLKQSTHVEYVDKYAGDALFLIKDTYKGLFEEKRNAERELEALKRDDSEKLKRLDILCFWADEISAANFTPGEEEELISRRDILQNAEKLQNSINEAYESLYGGEPSARDLLAEAAGSLKTAAEIDQGLSEALETLYDALYKSEDIAHELTSYRDSISGDPEELEDVLERIDLLNKFKKKYGETIEEIIEFGKNAEAEILEIETSGERILELEKRILELDEKLKHAAGELTRFRKRAAEEIEKKVMDELACLDMKNVSFKIDISECDYTFDGADRVEFLISTSPSEPLKPMVKIASGGEMSRICLALKTVLADADTVPTLIFDEIDTGVSGRAAVRIGERLRFLGRSKQVISITHLPQIASCASHHYLLEKELMGDAVTTRLKSLDKEERVAEVARMIGGDRISDKTLQTAEEMIDDFVE